MMDRKEDVEFLEQFRTRVERYLTLTTAEQSGRAGKHLKMQIGEMIPRAEKLFTEFGLENRGIGQHPPPMIAGRAPVINYPLLNLITSSTLRSHYYEPADASDEKVLDLALSTVDECIGHLKMSREEVNTSSMNRTQRVRSTGKGEGHVFIAMPMMTNDPLLTDAKNAIKDAASESGLSAERIDDQISNEKITDRIVEAIKDADFVVVDLTHGRPNVFWEAGYAHGLGKTPIYIAKKDTNLEFDVQDYPVIFYENYSGLKERLVERLKHLKDAM